MNNELREKLRSAGKARKRSDSGAVVAKLRAAVVVARESGATWDEIADAAMISPQAAANNYAAAVSAD